MTDIPILAVVATFTFSTAPRHKLGTHPTSSHRLRLHGAIPPFPHTFHSMKFNEAKRQVYLYLL